MAQLVGITYARALYDLGIEKNNLNEVYSDFKEIAQLIKGNKDLKEILTSPRIEPNERKTIVNTLFSGKIDVDLLNFLKILIDKGRMFYILSVFQEYENFYFEHKNIKRVIVTSAVALSEDEIQRLSVQIKKANNCDIVIEQKIDKSIVGGLNIQVGEQLYEGSVKKRMENLQSELSKLVLI